MDESHSHNAHWEQISGAGRHGHGAVGVVMATQPSASLQSGVDSEVTESSLFVAAGGRCTLASMNKRRAGTQMNNEGGELKLEVAEPVCQCNLLNSAARRQSPGERWLYFSLKSTLEENISEERERGSADGELNPRTGQKLEVRRNKIYWNMNLNV